MKTRRSQKSFEAPPSPRKRNARRKSGKRPLKACNTIEETIVISSDSEEEECVEVVDIADGSSDVGVGNAVGQVDELELEPLEEGELETTRPLLEESSQLGNVDGESFKPLANSTVLQRTPSSTPDNRSHSPKASTSSSRPRHSPAGGTAAKANVPVPIIDILDGDDQSTEIVDDDDVEVVAVVVSGAKNKRLSRGSLKGKRCSIGEAKSNGLSIMQESIKRAKNVVRRSSSNSSSIRGQTPLQNGWGNAFKYNGISANSRGIAKSNKKKNKKFNRGWMQQQQRANRPFNMNRSREFNRQVIFRPGSGHNPVEGITVNVRNPGIFRNPVYNPSSSGPAHGYRINKERKNPWISMIRPTGSGPVPVPGSNIMNAGESTNRPAGTLRPIVIDGSNIAFGHGGMLLGPGGLKFSARGIQICVDYFLKRGHKEIKVFVPRFRLKKSECLDPELLEGMEKSGHVVFTASREAGDVRIASYDDLYILRYAHETGGIVVSNDNYRDLYIKNPELQETITLRILQYTWVTEKCLMFPEDPLGKNGPSLDRFLMF